MKRIIYGFAIALQYYAYEVIVQLGTKYVTKSWCQDSEDVKLDVQCYLTREIGSIQFYYYYYYYYF